MQIKVPDQVQSLIADVAKDHITNNVVRRYTKPITLVVAFVMIGIYSLLDWLIASLESFDPQKIEELLTRHPLLLLTLLGVWLLWLCQKALQHTN